MASDLITIGRSGTAAARAALDVTAQNIANANNEDYARRSVALSDVTASARVGGYDSNVQSGVRVDAVVRGNAPFLQNEVRRTSSDLAQAEAELAGLGRAEAAVEQTGVFPALVEFEAALGALRADPLNGALRQSTIEQARAVADTLQLADTSLAASAEQSRLEAAGGVDVVNSAAQELARINDALARARSGTAGHANLLDQRDLQLSRLSQQVGFAVSFQSTGAAEVRLGDASGPVLVQGTTAGTLAMATQTDGTIAFTLDGTSASPASGALAGHAQALTAQRDVGAQLDALAVQLITLTNTAQANGTTPAGSAGAPLFSGTDAASIALSLTDGSGLATAPAGAGANSRDPANLDALRAALATGGPTAAADEILTTIASRISARDSTREALATLADSAQSALQRQTAVDLDAEAANLVRYQQAFQASGRVIQAAAEIFDTILGIR